MLVTFTTDAYANIPMFRDIALTMLKMMGHSPTIPGAILAADVPTALNRLRAAVNAEKESVSVEGENENENEPVVSISTRALPLIDLLTAAAKEGCDVMWK